MPAPKDDHTDRQALREKLIKIIDTYGYDELPTAEHVADAMLKVIDAYTEQRLKGASEKPKPQEAAGGKQVDKRSEVANHV